MGNDQPNPSPTPPDIDFGGWETERDKRLWDLSLSPERRLQRLADMIEFARLIRDSHVVRRDT